MQLIKADLFCGTITIGLNIGYTENVIPIERVYQELSAFQDDLIKTKNIYISANCTESIIVFSGQREPHINIKFINYPRFPLTEDIFKAAVIEIATHLLSALSQNRMVIEFHDGFVMLQENDDIDPKILTTES